MATAKNSVKGSMAAGKEISQAKDPRAALDAAKAHAQPRMAGALAYGEQLKVIIEDIHSEFTQAADTHIAEAKNTLSALIYDVTQNVKPGSEMRWRSSRPRSTMRSRSYEQVTKATRQAQQVVEAQIARATAQIVPADAKRK
jgi:phasin family protein